MSHVPYYVLLRPNGEHARYPVNKGYVLSVHAIDKKNRRPGGHCQIAMAEADLGQEPVQIGFFPTPPETPYVNLPRAVRLAGEHEPGVLFSVHRDGKDMVLHSHDHPPPANFRKPLLVLPATSQSVWPNSPTSRTSTSAHSGTSACAS